MERLIHIEMFRESNLLLDSLLQDSSSDSDSDDDDDDSDDDISDSDNTVPTLITHYSRTIENRYLERGKYRNAGNRVMERDFGRSPVAKKPYWLNEDEFRQRYRMNRGSFEAVLDSIKENSIFVSVGKRKQRPVGHQLAVYMRFIGNSGAVLRPFGMTWNLGWALLISMCGVLSRQSTLVSRINTVGLIPQNANQLQIFLRSTTIYLSVLVSLTGLCIV